MLYEVITIPNSTHVYNSLPVYIYPNPNSGILRFSGDMVEHLERADRNNFV